MMDESDVVERRSSHDGKRREPEVKRNTWAMKQTTQTGVVGVVGRFLATFAQPGFQK